MGRREEIDAEITKLQAERAALDGVVVIPSDEYARMLRVLDRAYDMADPDTGQVLYELSERMEAYNPQPIGPPLRGGLTQEQGEQVLCWLEHLRRQSVYIPALNDLGDRLAAALGQSWDSTSTEDPRGAA